MENYSYVTLLTNDSYIYGVILLAQSMKYVKTKYPLYVLVTDTVSSATIEILKQLNINYELIDKIEISADIMEYNNKIDPKKTGIWRFCWTKFKIFDQVQFDKIIFLDADILVLKNLDHLFEKPHMTAAIDGEYFNLWPDWLHFNSGCMIIEPSHDLYLDILNFAKNLDINNLPKYVIADQEVLNFYFKDWPEQEHLHLNKYYNTFAPYVLSEHLEDIRKNSYFIHYIGRKPWNFWIKSDFESYDEYFYNFGREIIQDAVQTLDWDKVRAQLVLSVYAICRNEKDNIKKWLNSFGEADYVCILDTGSTDGTWELLQEESKKRKNLIIKQKIITPWRFDTARNESMKIIPNDTTIYFMADLDEIIKESGWSQEIKSKWTPIFSRGEYTYNRDVDTETDSVLRAIKEYRIHSKEWNKWINIVHEAIVNIKGEKQFFVETCTPINIAVWHYPKKDKKTDYMELCEQDLKEYPNDWVMHLQLAIEYEIREKNDKALEHYLYIIDNKNTLQPFELARCYFGVGRIFANSLNYDLALNYFREGRLIDPTLIDNYLAAAEIYYQNKNFQRAIELSKDGLDNSSQAYWCSVYDPQSYYPYYLLGINNYLNGNKLLALSYLYIAQLKNPEDSIKLITNSIVNEIITK